MLDRCNRYSFLSGFVLRTDEEEAEVQELHKEFGEHTGWHVEPRDVTWKARILKGGTPVKRLTDKQVELLCSLLPQPGTASDIAFQTDTTTSAATRVMHGLCKHLFVYADLLETGRGGDYSYIVTEAGIQWVRENRERVKRVHLALGFQSEEIDSIFTPGGGAG